MFKQLIGVGQSFAFGVAKPKTKFPIKDQSQHYLELPLSKDLEKYKSDAKDITFVISFLGESLPNFFIWRTKAFELSIKMV